MSKHKIVTATPELHYMTLGAVPAATPEVLRECFLKLAEDLHPDRERCTKHCTTDHHVPTCRVLIQTQRFASVTAAYAVLKDKQRRAQYDGQLRMLGLICTHCAGFGLSKRTRGFTGIRREICGECLGNGHNNSKLQRG